MRFRSLVESPTLKRARGDNEAPLPELKPGRQAARQSLRKALEIVRAVLQKRAQQGHDDARQTLEDEIWWANSRLHCEPAATRPNISNDKRPIDVPLRRVVLEDAMRTLERGARHLDLPPDFWRAMLQAVDCLGLIMQHRRYEKALALALKA